MAGGGEGPGGRPIEQSRNFAPDFDKVLQGKPPGIPTILLVHQPKGTKEAAKRGVELTLSGHTHGGQFGFKSIKWSLANPFLKYDMGLFQKGKASSM